MVKRIIYLFITCLLFINSALALNWNDPGVTPVQSVSDHRWRDANTGRFINTTNMPDDYWNIGTQVAPAVATAIPNGTASTVAPTVATVVSNGTAPYNPQQRQINGPISLATPNIPANNPVTPTPAPYNTRQPQINGPISLAPNQPTASTGTTPPTGPTTTTPTGTTPPTGPATTTPTGTTTAGPATNPSFGSKVKANWNAKKTTGKIATVAGAVGGTAMVYSATKGQEAHTATDVLTGVTGGAMAGASIGSVIPGVGTVMGAIAGGVIGGLFPGSQLFAETDCLDDPVTGKYTCCNTVFNKGERYVEIGGYMFCDALDANGTPLPGVRQCLQGGQPTKLSWWDGLWQDDTWSTECTPRWCDDKEPPNEDIILIADKSKICYNWKLATPTQDSTDPYMQLMYKIDTQIKQYNSQCGTLQ